MIAEKFLNIKRSCKLHELRYFQEVHALAEDVHILWLMKCRYIMQGLFQHPEGLKIYCNGKEEWLFDYLPTKEQASQIVAESCFTSFDVVMSRKGMLKDVV